MYAVIPQVTSYKLQLVVRPPVHLMVRTEWPHMSHRCTSWFVLNDRVSHRCTSRFVLNDYTWATGAPHGSYWMTTCEPPVHLMVHTEWPHVSHPCTSLYILNDHMWATGVGHGSQSDRKLLYYRNQLNDAIKYLIVLPTDLALHLEDSWIQSWSHICTSICSSSNLKCDLAASYQIYYNQKQSWFLSTADTVLLTNNIKLRAFFSGHNKC